MPFLPPNQQRQSTEGIVCYVFFFAVVGSLSVVLMLYYIAGDTGANIQSFLNDAFTCEFLFPHIQVIFPTAPFR